MRQRMVEARVGHADLASVFSSAVLKDFAHPNPGVLSRRIANAAVLVSDQPDATVADALDVALDALRRDYRSEYVFKNALVSKIVFGHHNPRTASALLEVPMGASCADVMIINGTSTVYEVKTDLDQFNRLSTQLSDYETRAEHVFVVVSEKRASTAEKYLPHNVGLLALTNRNYLRKLRPPTSNLPRLDVAHLFGLLRRHEVLNVLRRQFDYSPDVAPIALWARTRELFLGMDAATAHAEMVAELRARGTGAAILAETDGFPRSWRALAFSTELSGTARRRLEERMNRPASLFLES